MAGKQNPTRQFVIYLSTGEMTGVEAPSLRTAIRQAEKENKGVEIVAALERSCLPLPTSEGMPFHAVLLRNPDFVPPEHP